MRRFLDDAGSDSDGGEESEGGDGVRSEGAGEEGEGGGDEGKMLEGIDLKIKMLEKSEAAEVKR